MTGIELIAQERQRQIEQEGWTPQYDAGLTNDELAIAAAYYTARGTKAEALFGILIDKSGYTRIEQLKIAGALIAAEIDRLLTIEYAKE